MVRISLAGAQIPLELTESWLLDADAPRFNVERVQPVFLSQHGFQNLLNGECDVACTDRRIERKELERFGNRRIESYRVAFYGFALYVHPDNPLDAVFSRHLSLLFQKRIRDWKELGGRAGPVRLIGPRKSTRGGMVLMRRAGIWFGDPTWEALETDAEIIDAVAADPQALGFATIGLDQGVRYLGLRVKRTGRAAYPSLEEIESDRYGLAKVIYIHVESPPSDAAQAVLDYLFSDQGRAAIESTNVWPIPRERARVSPNR